MAIFRGTGGSVNSTDASIVSAVTTQAGIATTKAGEAATSATTATTKASEASASATTATTKANEASDSANTASTKATEANTAKTAAEAAQTAAESARDTAQTHANTANNSSVQTVAGISTEVQNLNSIANDISGVNTIKSDVTTVAGISSNVTTVAADASDIGTVATNIANVNNVGNNIANVNSVAGNASNINTVAADASDIGTVSSNISNVNTVAGISSDVTTVAGLESKMDTVIADASDIGAVANNIGDVSTVAGINADVDTVAGISAKVTTVADNITDVQNADTNAANASASASQAANSESSASASASTATTKASEAEASATTAASHATTATTKASQAAGSATTATTKASEAASSALSASSSATTATTKASEALNSANTANSSATTATTKASEADASANSAASSATDAQTAANAWSGYFNTYLGSYSAPPTVDSQGNALQTGAFYYDTGVSNARGLYVYSGSSWLYSTNYNNVTAPYTLAQDLATDDNDISFGDNAKAKFGASNDLQIYHTGSESRIEDAGTGLLTLRSQGTGIQFWDTANGGYMLNATVGGAVDLYHNRSKKLATTSTGINVTGAIKAIESGDNASIIMRGFNSSTDSGLASLFSGTSRSAFGGLIESGTNGQLVVGVRNNDNSDGFSIVSGGGHPEYMDDSVYDTELFTVRSSGNVGINTSSPSHALDVNSGTVNDAVRFKSTDDTVSIVLEDDNTTNRINSSGTGIRFDIGNSEAVRIAPSGNVGIGTTSPASELHVDGTATISYSGTSANSFYQGNVHGYGKIVPFSHHGMLEFDTNYSSGGGYKFSYNGTERMRINSSGNVGIGTTNPSEALEVNGNLAFSGGSDKGIIGPDFRSLNIFANPNSTSEGIKFSTDGGTTTEVFIQDGGKVGIGTDSPLDLLHINSNTTDARLLLDGHTNFDAELKFAENGSIKYTVGHDAGTDTFRIGTTNVDTNPRLVIDSSGNLLVGKTASSLDTTGIQLQNDGLLRATRSGADVLQLNRQSSDGALANFYKDGTTVGKIGTSGSKILIGTDDTGLFFNNTSDAVEPINTSTQAARDSAIDIGSSARRFKDLYLSGGVLSTNSGNLSINSTGSSFTFGNSGANIHFDSGAFRPFSADDNTIDLGNSSCRYKDIYLSGGVHLGGTGSANKLDDYEEGTWTPTASTNVASLSSVHGTYTKVGRLVTVSFTFVADLTSITQFNIGGLPFAVGDNLNNTALEATGIVYSSGNSAATFMSYASHNSTQLVISTTLSGVRADNQQYRGSITYQT